MLELRFSGLYEERRRGDPVPFVDVSATEFSIVVGGKTLYSERRMPVVELVAALVGWLRVPVESRFDFEFESMSTDQAGSVWIRRNNGSWRIGSIHQDYAELREFSDAQIRTAVEQLRSQLLSAADETLEFDLRAYVPAIVNPA